MCTPALVSGAVPLAVPAAQACPGTWQYRVFKPNVAGCGVPHCPLNPSGKPDVSKVPPSSETFKYKVHASTRVVICEEQEDLHGNIQEVCRPDADVARDRCDAFEAAKVKELLSGLPSDQKNEATIVYSDLLFAPYTRKTVDYAFDCSFNIELKITRNDEICNQALVTDACDVPDPAWRVSPGGLTLAGVSATLPAKDRLIEANSALTSDDDAPRCLPCTALPSPAQDSPLAAQQQAAQAKYACLQSVPASTDVQRWKILTYELYGQLLSDAQRRDAALQYATSEALPSCGVALDAPAPTPTCASPVPGAGLSTLRRCERLLSSHVPSGVISYALPACAELVESYAQLARTSADRECGGPRLRQLGARFLFDLTDRQLDQLGTAPAGLGLLARQLWLVDAWYRHATTAAQLGVSSPDDARRAASQLLGRLWSELRGARRVHAELSSLSSAASAEAVEGALGLSVAKGRQVDQEMVQALFSVPPAFVDGVTLTAPPMAGPPLLALLGDALTPFVDDLDGLVAYHDVACQFTDCRVPALSTPSRSAWKLLGALDQPALATLAAATPQALAGWRTTLSTLAARQGLLLDALRAAAPGASAFTAVSDAGIDALARPLWRVLRLARARRDHFEATGLFEPAPPDVLHAGLLNAQRDEVANDLAARVGELGRTVTAYHEGVKTAVREQLDLMANGANLQNLTSRRLKLAHEMQRKALDVEGLRKSGEAEDRTMGSITSAFAAVQDAVDAGGFTPVAASASFQVTGADATFVDAATTPLTSIAIRSFRGLVAGELALLDTSGVYQPTCLLRQQKFLQPDGLSDLGADLSDAKIGSEGYQLTWSNGAYRAQSKTKTTTDTVSLGVSWSLCSKSSAGVGGSVGVVTLSSGVESSTCVHADATHAVAWATSASTGTDQRTSASFASGLRLPGAPFADYPVGSLLLVLTPPGTTTIRDVQVVRTGSTSVLVEQASDAYVVLNDVKCDRPSVQDKLTVGLRRLASNGAVASAAIAAMTQVLADLRAQRDVLAGQGALLPSQAVLLRQQAQQALQARLQNLAVDRLPAPLASLFDAFVTHEIVGLERVLEIRAIERSLDLDLADLRAIDDELAAGAQRGRLQKLLPEWTLRDLDHDRLRDQLTDTLVVARDYLRPMIDLWYPGVLTRLAGSSQVSALLAADVDTSLVTLAAEAQHLLEKVISEYRIAKLGSKEPGQALPIVTVSFPRPGAPLATFPPVRTVDPARAMQAWDAVLHGGKAVFALRPEDFYSANGGSGVLSCGEVVPVVRSMQVYAVTSDPFVNDAFNLANWWLAGTVSATQTFVTPSGPRTYQLADGVWSDITVPIRFGTHANAVADMGATTKRSRPVGLSAATTFEIDFSSLVDPASGASAAPSFADVTEIVVELEIDSRAANPGATWVSRCH